MLENTGEQEWKQKRAAGDVSRSPGERRVVMTGEAGLLGKY